MPSDQNYDHVGDPTWAIVGFISIILINSKFREVPEVLQRLAIMGNIKLNLSSIIYIVLHWTNYLFRYSLKEETEKLKQPNPKPTSATNANGESLPTKKRKSASQDIDKKDDSLVPMKIIKFGTNVDLSDNKLFPEQLRVTLISILNQLQIISSRNLIKCRRFVELIQLQICYRIWVILFWAWTPYNFIWKCPDAGLQVKQLYKQVCNSNHLKFRSFGK